MPLHRFFTPKGLYSDEDKAAISEAVTSVYVVIPKFYVVVVFIELEARNFFVGGKSTNKFLRIATEHYARNFPESVVYRHSVAQLTLIPTFGDQVKRGFMDRYEKALEPFTKGRGIDWEVQINDADRTMWNENGMAPPLPGTEEENMWKRENRALSPEEMRVLKALDEKKFL
ncbi:putative oxalocrotonate tautomerase [Mycena polygramma]|nr:putative oxalocrotonate tautomerase [Mycena polygramma]